MAGFRELAKAHHALVTAHDALQREHTETREALSRVIHAYNSFVTRGFVARLRWLFRGQ